MVSKAEQAGTTTPFDGICTLDNLKDVRENLRQVFASGKTLPYAWRHKQLKQLEKLLVENEDNIIGAVMQDLGKKTKLEAAASDWAVPLKVVRSCIRNLSGWMKPRSKYSPLLLFPASSEIIPSPKGTVLILSPWNYPVQLAIIPLAGAIAAGNTVLLKVSPFSANIARVLCELIPKYMDTSCVAVEGAGSKEIISAMLELQWDHIFFTGSTTVGKIVYQAAARYLTPVTLELGGKNPVYIDREVSNMEVAVRRIFWGKLLNCGQTCLAPDYVLCHKDSLDRFMETVPKVLKEFYGDNPKECASYGRIISEQHAGRIAELLKSGKVVVGGEHDVADKYIAPTVMIEPDMDSDLMGQEIFGPVIVVIPVGSAEEAITFINARPHALAVYVFGSNSKTTDLFKQKTRSGAIDVNSTLTHALNDSLPFGGVGDSGIGAYHGDLTFEVFSHMRASVSQNLAGPLDVPFKYPPYEGDSMFLRWKAGLVRFFVSSRF
eukprot:comp23270_c0_seq1/m.38080 comp23270_c0_seq1/g.38080  ORF comp23270_c0_seq1/g.38080 comp23270_c0_seq1/m.38080 type:complete len:491 (-) comp23270_c0_seq1:82-1554(-)